jgi:Cu-Zn family superoxide dismutase
MMQIPWAPLLCVALSLPLLGCASATADRAPMAARSGSSALVKLLTPTGASAGQAVLTTVPDGVEIVVRAEGLTPGLHGLHIHQNGRCAPAPDANGTQVAFGAAGGHFDVTGAGRHGHPEQAGPQHAGDLPNLQADPEGRASLRYTSPRITLQSGGGNSVLGRALVVHATADDYQSQPAGNSGGRVLCGVIEPAWLDAVVGSAGGARHLQR